MNVYTRATLGGTFVTLVLLAGILALDMWLMSKFPDLQHGLGYILLQIAMLGVFLKVLYLIFNGRRHRQDKV